MPKKLSNVIKLVNALHTYFSIPNPTFIFPLQKNYTQNICRYFQCHKKQKTNSLPLLNPFPPRHLHPRTLPCPHGKNIICSNKVSQLNPKIRRRGENHHTRKRPNCRARPSKKTTNRRRTNLFRSNTPPLPPLLRVAQ